MPPGIPRTRKWRTRGPGSTTCWAWRPKPSPSTNAAWLSEEDRHGALLGLGHTYRVPRQYAKAVETLRLGVAEFPEDGALQSFLATALFNTEQHHEAMRILLRLLATTSQDAYVQQYRRAIEHYARDLDATV